MGTALLIKTHQLEEMGDGDTSARVDEPSGKRLGWIDEDWRELFTPISSSRSMPHNLRGAGSTSKHTCPFGLGLEYSVCFSADRNVRDRQTQKDKSAAR